MSKSSWPENLTKKKQTPVLSRWLIRANETLAASVHTSHTGRASSTLFMLLEIWPLALAARLQSQYLYLRLMALRPRRVLVSAAL